MVPDRIEHEITVEAPTERVWEVLTKAEHVGRWFGDAGAEIDLRPGGAMALTWEEHGTGYARVEKVEYPRLFSFRWTLLAGEQPGDGNSTLVEFTLVPDGSGTRLRVVESGFQSLNVPDEEKIRHAKGNTEGWAIELDDLKRYLQRSAM